MAVEVQLEIQLEVQLEVQLKAAEVVRGLEAVGWLAVVAVGYLWTRQVVGKVPVETKLGLAPALVLSLIHI